MNLSIYQTNGIEILDLSEVKGNFFVVEDHDIDNEFSKYSYPGDEIIYEIDSACVDLYEIFRNKIFLNQDEYYKYLKLQPQGLMRAGLDSDCNLSKEMFEKYFVSTIQGIVGEKEFYKGLNEKKFKYAYLADCDSLINTLQELIQNCHSYLISFYKMLCLHPVRFNFTDDYYALTAMGRSIFSFASNLIISFYSIFDILTKIAYELEHIKECETSYERLSSRKILFGAKKKLQLKSKESTIFEDNKNISIVANLRHELIHNATWEMNPKIFFSIRNNKLVDKCIYMPDFSKEGNLITYKNRKRFYAQGKKLNEELPEIYFDILKRILITIQRME